MSEARIWLAQLLECLPIHLAADPDALNSILMHLDMTEADSSMQMLVQGVQTGLQLGKRLSPSVTGYAGKNGGYCVGAAVAAVDVAASCYQAAAFHTAADVGWVNPGAAWGRGTTSYTAIRGGFGGRYHK